MKYRYLQQIAAGTDVDDEIKSTQFYKNAPNGLGSGTL